MLALLAGALVMSAAPVVPTRVQEVVETIHGVKVRDPYRWLEDAGAAEVQSWTARQNQQLRGALDPVPGRKWIERRLWALHEVGALGVPVVKGRGARMTLFYIRRDGKQNQPILYAREGIQGTDRAVVDVNALRADGTMALDWWFPSEDGRLVAYGTSAGGDEKSTLRVRVVKTGKDLGDVIPNTRYSSVAWLPDGKGFYYTRYPAKGTVPAGEEDYHQHVFFHRLGDDPAQDAKIFGEGLKMTLSPQLAPLSPDGRWLLIGHYDGWAKNDLYLLDRKKTGAVPVQIVTGRPALFNVSEVLDDRVYVHTNDEAPRYRVMVFDPRKPARQGWQELLAEGKDTLDGVSYVGGKLAALYLADASSRVRLFSRAGKPVREVSLPGLGTVAALNGRHRGDDLFFAFSSYLAPTQVFRHDLARGGTTVWRKLEAPIDASSYTVDQVRYTSKDGTSVPMFLVHRKGLVRDGSAPTLLYGYGGFNINLTPAYAAAMAPFVEAGGVYAVANLRGGGEYGEAWHQAGMLGRKQTVFDDFAAAAEWLIKEKVTSPARLAISGRSNGGLLVGAAITQRPELFKAAVSGVPLLDMVRYHRFRIAKLWIPEYGSSDDPKQFAWLHAYSPYHRVKDGVDYPATLIFTAEGDSRVDPLHARKMTARLQLATAGKKGPVLLRLETQAGHGQGKPLAKVIAQHTDELAFLFSQLGLKAPSVD